MPKPRLAIDVDDTLADFIRSFDDYLNERYGLGLARENAATVRLGEILQCDHDEVLRIYGDFYASPHYFDMPPTEGALEAMTALSERYDLVVLTARAHPFHASTRDWVAHHFPGLFSRIVFISAADPRDCSTKGAICEELGIVALVDDNYHFLDELKPPTRGLLLDAPWNSGHPDTDKIRRVAGWDDVKRELLG